MGKMRTIITEWADSTIESFRARRINARAINDQYKRMLSTVTEGAKYVQPETDGFIPVGDAGEKVLDETDTATLREQAIRASYLSPLIISYLNNLQRFVMGKGITVNPTTEDQQLHERLLYVWNEWERQNNWQSLEREIAHRLWRDGEVFIWRVNNNSDLSGDMELANNLRDFGLTVEDVATTEYMLDLGLRLIDPEYIRDPLDQVSHGILTASGDVENVVGYLYSVSNTPQDRAFIPADDVIHIKIRVDSDTKRGRSVIEPLLQPNAYYEEWLEYRMVLSKVRTAVAWVRTVDGSPTQVSSIRDNQATQRPTDYVRGDKRLQMPRAGTVITASNGINYDFKSPNLQAADSSHDGREIKLNIAASTGLPEYMFGDASNANYASTMVAESPAVREFEYWQDFLSGYFAQIWDWVIGSAVDAGLVSETELLTGGGAVDITFEPMLARSAVDEAKANQIKNAAGVLSRRSWAEETGLDYETERLRIADEKEQDIELGISGGFDIEPPDDEPEAMPDDEPDAGGF
jgi:hypothetical protein